MHREADEHQSFGRVSQVSAKKGRMSDLLYDTVQEKIIKQQKEDETSETLKEDDPPRMVRRVDEAPEDQDDEHQYIQDILDEQILDLDANYDNYKILESD